MATQHSLQIEVSDSAESRAAAKPSLDREPRQSGAQPSECAGLPRLEQFRNILRPALSCRHGVDWTALKRDEAFPEAEPEPPRYLEYPPEPNADDSRYRPAGGSGVSPADPAAAQRQREAYERFIHDYQAWAEQVRKIEVENARRYAEGVAAVRQWNSRCRQHRQSLVRHNEAVDLRKTQYEALLASAVEDYCRQILSVSNWLEGFKRVFDIQYLADARTLIVDHSLPLPRDLPCVKGARFVKTRGEQVEVRLSQAELNRFHADVVFQICLRTIHELFDADLAQGLKVVAFNGWIETTDAASGQSSRTCLMTVKAEKERFTALDLAATEAKAAFKALKGKAPARLHTLAPVTPVMSIQRPSLPPANAASVTPEKSQDEPGSAAAASSTPGTD
jgi:restriction system protein